MLLNADVKNIIFLMASGLGLLFFLWFLWKIYIAFKSEEQAYEFFEQEFSKKSEKVK